MFGGQFVFLFFAMQAGLPPGLTSVLVQLQGPLTVVLAALFLREHATRGQWLGLAVAGVGVVLIARSVEGSVGVFAVLPGAPVGADLGGRQPLLPLGPRRVDVRRHRLGEPVAAAAARPDRAGAGRPRPAPDAHPGADLEGLVRALLYGRAGDVAGLPDLGHAAAHLSRRQGRADLAAGALHGAGLRRRSWSASRSAACASWAWWSCWAAWRWACSPRRGGCADTLATVIGTSAAPADRCAARSRSVRRGLPDAAAAPGGASSRSG